MFCIGDNLENNNSELKRIMSEIRLMCLLMHEKSWDTMIDRRVPTANVTQKDTFLKQERIVVEL